MAAAVPLITAVAGIGSTVYSTMQSNKQQKLVSAAQKNQQAEIDAQKKKQAAQESALKNLMVGGRSKGMLAFSDEKDDGLGSTFG